MSILRKFICFNLSVSRNFSRLINLIVFSKKKDLSPNILKSLLFFLKYLDSKFISFNVDEDVSSVCFNFFSSSFSPIPKLKIKRAVREQRMFLKMSSEKLFLSKF